jgi:hypothetical protein
MRLLNINRRRRMKVGAKKKLGVFMKYKGRCAYCGRELNDENYTIDRLVPGTAGGTYEFENCMPACKSCNSSKGSKTLEEYRKYLNWSELAEEAQAQGVTVTPAQLHNLAQLFPLVHEAFRSEKLYCPHYDFYFEIMELGILTKEEILTYHDIINTAKLVGSIPIEILKSQIAKWE